MWDIGLILAKYSVVLHALVIGIALSGWRELSYGKKIVGATLILVMINQIAGIKFGEHFQNSYPFYHAYVLIEFLGLAFFFLSRNLMPRKVVLSIMAGFTVFWIVNITVLQSIYGYPSISRVTESALMLLFTLNYFRITLSRLEDVALHKTFMFWVCSAWMVYFSATGLIDAFGNLFIAQTDQEAWGAIFSVRGLLNILLYLSLCIAFLLRDETKYARFSSSD